MSTEKKSSAGGTVVTIIVGAIIMVAGMALAQQDKPEFIKSLEAQGIFLDPGMTIATIGVFIILFPVIRSFFINPLADAINERNNELETTFTEAENLRAQMEKMRSDYEKRIADTEADAREKIQAQIKEAQAIRQSVMAEATQKADELKRKAQQDIESERDKVITELRLKVVDLALAATEKVIGENMDTEKNRKLVQEFVEKAEVAQ